MRGALAIQVWKGIVPKYLGINKGKGWEIAGQTLIIKSAQTPAKIREVA
jgi:hypothetical protein